MEVNSILYCPRNFEKKLKKLQLITIEIQRVVRDYDKQLHTNEIDNLE